MIDGLDKLSERAFLQQLQELTTGLRTEIEARSRRVDPSPAAIAERRKRVLQGDFEFFAWHYFPHHVWGPPSKFQRHFCNRFPQLLRLEHGVTEWWQAPRGESKTTLLTKLGPVWIDVQQLLQDEAERRAIGWNGKAPPNLDYTLLLGAETKMPTKLLAVVKTELEANQNLALDFPEVAGASRQWRVSDIVTRMGQKIEPFGAEQAIRGTFSGASRPKCLFGDDLITDAEAKSPTERDNRWTWVTKAVQYLGPPDGSVKAINVGTTLNKDDPISRAERTVGHVVHKFRAIEQLPKRLDLWEKCEELMRNDDQKAATTNAAAGTVAGLKDLPSYQFYKKNKRAMDAGAVTSWPEVRSLYALMRQRATTPKAFKSEMQGDPRDDADKVFTDISFWVHQSDRWYFYGACDPSMGKTQKSDPSGLIVGGWDAEKSKAFVAEASSKRRVPAKLMSDLITLQEVYSCGAWGFESNNAYEYMRTQFMQQALERGVTLPLVGVPASTPMEVRIEALEPFINGVDPKLLFKAELKLLLDQLDEWPEKQSHHHFDLLSALALFWDVASKRRSGRIEVRTGKRRDTLAGYPGAY